MHFSRATTLGGALLCAAIHAHAGAVDAKLLDMLLANGSITQAQHAELTADLAREARAEKRAAKEKLDKSEFTEFQQKAGWAANTALRGDMRVRNDYIAIEDEPKTGRDRDRQRIRARLGAFTQVNPEVEVGIQVATGNGPDQRSPNQDIDNYFTKKSLWLDLGYIDYHPANVPGLKLFGGKMKQPWMAVSDMMWDSDINPEGFATQYTRKSGTTTYFGSASYMILKDNVDGDGVEWANDLHMLQAQVGTAFDAGDSIRLTLGASINEFDNENQAVPTSATEPVVALWTNGNTTDQFRLFELFGQMDVIGLPLPLSIYGQWIRNTESDDLTFVTPTETTVYTDGDEDTAWMFGARTNLVGVAFDYQYRNNERNAVVGSLTDSDFASGYTGSKGHRFKAQYDFLENFNLTVTWFLAESDAASRFEADDAEVETLMIDLNAKF
jgi:polyhydroxyalkanoate synthesis regulator phasin